MSIWFYNDSFAVNLDFLCVFFYKTIIILNNPNNHDFNVKVGNTVQSSLSLFISQNNLAI